MVSKSRMITYIIIVLGLLFCVSSVFAYTQYKWNNSLKELQQIREQEIKQEYISQINAKDAEIIGLQREKQRIITRIVYKAKESVKIKPSVDMEKLKVSFEELGYETSK